MKTRREVLQGMIVAVGGASMLSACGGIANIAASGSGSMRFFSADEADLVSRISDLLIPRTDTPGALDVNVPGFIDSLMMEWANPETKAAQHAALSQVSELLGDDFGSLNPADAERRLSSMDASAYDGRPAQYSSYRSLKGLVTQSYFASEEGALEEQGYVAIPGRWDACVEIS